VEDSAGAHTATRQPEAVVAAHAAPANTLAGDEDRAACDAPRGGAVPPAAPSKQPGRLLPPGWDACMGGASPVGQRPAAQRPEHASGATASASQQESSPRMQQEWDDTSAHTGEPCQSQQRRAPPRVDAGSAIGDSNDSMDMDEDNTLCAASEASSDPSSTYLNEPRAARPAVASARKAPARDRDSDSAALERQAEQLGGAGMARKQPTNASTAREGKPSEDQLPGAVDDEDVLSQLLGDLGVSEAGGPPAQPDSNPFSMQSATSPAVAPRVHAVPRVANNGAAVKPLPLAGGRARGHSAHKRRAAVPQADDDTLLCPITQVGVCVSGFRLGWP